MNNYLNKDLVGKHTPVGGYQALLHTELGDNGATWQGRQGAA